MIKATDFEAIFCKRLATGKEVLPNFHRVSHAALLNDLASGGHSLIGRHGNARIDPMKSYAPWAMFYLSRTQAGALDGNGMVIIYAGNGEPVTGTFSICMHHAVELPGANHRRGWHPARCSKCGLNMSVDSGD